MERNRSTASRTRQFIKKKEATSNEEESGEEDDT